VSLNISGKEYSGNVWMYYDNGTFISYGTPVTIVDNNGHYAQGYAGVPVESNQGSVNIVMSPGVTYTMITNSIVGTNTQTYDVIIIDSSKFSIIINANFPSSPSDTQYQISLRVKDDLDGSEAYFSFYTYYYFSQLWSSAGVQSSDQDQLFSASAQINADETYKIEFAIDGKNVAFKINDSIIATGVAAIENPFAAVNELTLHTVGAGQVFYVYGLEIIDQVATLSPGWENIDSGFNYNQIIGINLNNDITVKNTITAEETTISAIANGSTISGGDYFTISSPSQDYYVWYTVDGAGADPAVTGLFIEGIVVAILSTDAANDVAVKTAAAIDAYLTNGLQVFDVPIPAGTTIVITNIVLGEAVNPAADGESPHGTGFTFSVIAGTEECFFGYICEDSLASTDSISSTASLNENITDTVEVEEYYELDWVLSGGSILELLLNENMDTGDASSYCNTVPKTVSDAMSITETISDLHTVPNQIIELLFIYEELKLGWAVTNNESLVLTDSTSEVLGLMINDWLTLIDSQTNNWNGRDIINDTLNLYDIAEKYFSVTASISEEITLTDTNNYVLTVAVLEYLGFSDLANALRTTAASLSESLVLIDSPDHAWQEIIQEALSAVDAASVVTTFVDVIQEALSAVDTASVINRIGMALNEALVLTETISSRGTFYTAVYDTIAMNVTVELGNEVYECYVLNTPKFHPSMYSGFNFNSYCVFENRAFGANDTGIYELTGTTDAGSTIHDGVILSKTDFGLRNNKRFRKGCLGISGTSPVMVFECEDGSRQVYNIDTKGMVVASHEQKSKSWKLSIADFDTLDVMKLIPIILSK